MVLNESVIKEPALERLGKLGYSIGRGQQLSITYKFDLREGRSHERPATAKF